MASSEKILQKSIGCRVKSARDAKGWTQDDLARGLGLKDRQSVSDIENGKRALKPEELVALSDILDREVEFFIDPFSVAGEAAFSWRAATEAPEESLKEFELRAGQWIGLLRWLRRQSGGKINPFKYSLRLNVKSTFEEAIASAERMVEALDLGKQPAERLVECVENSLDIPILFIDPVDIPQDCAISGAACNLPDLGVILVNRKEPEGRRFFDIAHELFHALTWDAMKPKHREPNEPEAPGRRDRVEQLADNFAAGLLMPEAALDQLIDSRYIRDIQHLADVAAQLKVSLASLAWRLFNLKRIDKATCEALLKQKHQPLSHPSIPKRYSRSFVSLLYEAIDKGRLSARKAAKALGMSLPMLSDLFIEHSMEAPFEL
ncbi:helix-turn-helix domain protein [Desulfatibacillum aliphaticivorans]|uniref:Helix-turn-helix domain protein n=1 Tax=Desulfatibacillum aliphaticivorans TaxID=218208 RepID=B8FLP7_DESAL|nr:XRE family transcriptional regulator [Desulfatibacillum aliphaticivorans]ACL05401.1 helix-turn-helix domain protein [Desulfatibacillum aliphaticivorans]